MNKPTTAQRFERLPTSKMEKSLQARIELGELGVTLGDFVPYGITTQLTSPEYRAFLIGVNAGLYLTVKLIEKGLANATEKGLANATDGRG